MHMSDVEKIKQYSLSRIEFAESMGHDNSPEVENSSQVTLKLN